MGKRVPDTGVRLSRLGERVRGSRASHTADVPFAHLGEQPTEAIGHTGFTQELSCARVDQAVYAPHGPW